MKNDRRTTEKNGTTDRLLDWILEIKNIKPGSKDPKIANNHQRNMQSTYQKKLEVKYVTGRGTRKNQHREKEKRCRKRDGLMTKAKTTKEGKEREVKPAK